MNELIVIWTSNNSNIVNISITLEWESNKLSIEPVDCYKKWTSIMVAEAEADYTIKVTEHNKCGQNFSSEEYYYNGSHSTGLPKSSGGKNFVCNSWLLSFIFSWSSDIHHRLYTSCYKLGKLKRTAIIM